MKKTPSKTSPRGSRRGCLGADGTYSIKNCDGSLQSQGVGSLVGGGYSEIKRTGRAFSEGFSNGFK